MGREKARSFSSGNLDATPAAAHAHGTTRQPFSRWLCLWDPSRALDQKLTQPFGKLVVHVDKGVGLLPMDFHNGLSDPYCILILNGEEHTKTKTRIVNKSLAPNWNESFQFELYHPLSALRIKVYDKDFGSEWGLINMLGMGDDFMGWVDISIATLPLNEWVTGWFHLCHPDHWTDSITGQKVGDEGPKPAGRIYLSLKVEGVSEDEFYALCLPRPALAMKETAEEEHFDLGNFVEHVLQVMELLVQRLKIAQEAFTDLSSHFSPLKLWFLGISLTWFPGLILPTLVTFIWLLTYWMDSMDSAAKAAHEGSESEKGGDAKSADDEASPRGQLPTSDLTLKERLKAAYGRTKAKIYGERVKLKDRLKDPLLQNRHDGDDDDPTGAPLIDAPEDMVRVSQQNKERSHVLAERLHGFERFLPAEQISELRGFDENLKTFGEWTRALEAGLRHPHLRHAIRVSFLGIALALVVITVLLRSYELNLIQIGLTVWMTRMLWDNSPIGRLMAGISEMRRRDRVTMEPAKEAVADEPPEDGLPPLPEKRTLSMKEVQRMVIGAFYPPAGEEDGAFMENGEAEGPHFHPHHMKLVSVSTLTTCQDCGSYLVGFYEQGYMCEWCHRLVCHVCRKLIADDCPRRAPQPQRQASQPQQEGIISSCAGHLACCHGSAAHVQSPRNESAMEDGAAADKADPESDIRAVV